MTSVHLLRPEPERMSGQAQVYLAASAAIALVMGAACWFWGGWFRAPAYSTLLSVLPLWAWGLTWTASAALSGYAAVRRRELPARLSLIVSAGATGMWASGFIAAAIEGRLTGPTGIVGWFGLVLKDLIVCVDPLRTPLEPVLRRLRRLNGSSP